MKNFDLKNVIGSDKYGNHWNNFKFEVVYSKTRVARIYINDRKTGYVAGGYGYDKESSVIADMINDITILTKYSKKVYGNHEGRLCGGTGFSSIKESFESKRGNKLVKLYSGLVSDVYEITINQKYIKGAYNEAE